MKIPEIYQNPHIIRQEVHQGKRNRFILRFADNVLRTITDEEDAANEARLQKAAAQSWHRQQMEAIRKQKTAAEDGNDGE